MRVTTLLPHLAGLQVLQVTLAADALILDVRRQIAIARCPGCQRRSRAVHSAYTRHLADLPIGGRQVLLHVQVRRFRCRTRTCPRHTFVEPLPHLAGRYSRRTAPLQAYLEDIGLSLGGRPGARFARRQRVPTSRMTLLRLVRRLPLPAAGSPTVLGVDDFALRRGHHYGTVLVDLSAHRIVDLLPERTSEVVSAWLADREPPKIICRDRGGAYAEAAQRAAPEATQCADRFHLSSNAAAVLERVLARHPAAVRAATTGAAEAVAGAPVATALLPASPGVDALASGAPASDQNEATPAAESATGGRDPRQARRRARYEEVVALHRAGWSLTAIGAHLGLSRPTVRKYVAADAYPGIAPRRTVLRSGSAHAAYLRARWDAGCRDATVLYKELRARGFSGSLRMVQRAVAAWRPHPSPHGRGAARAASPQAGAATARPLSPRQATWLLLRSPEDLSGEEQMLRTRLLAISSTIQAALTAVAAFRTLVRTHDRAGLDPWLAAAAQSAVPEIRAFAASVQCDYAAIAAGLALPWSSGQVEGQVTKIKLRRRQMYGRGKLDLLRRRVILAS